jgi:hypothetical protein
VATLAEPRRPDDEAEERRLADAGVNRLLALEVRHEQYQLFLKGLEALTATRCSIDRVVEELPTDPVNLLRDFRLALAQGDGSTAEERFVALQKTGSLSRENLRFLRIELLARLERWHEAVSLPYFAELEKVRRPRRVSELMLEALWRAEILQSGLPPSEVFRETEFQDQHRALLGSAGVPRMRGALALCYLSALQDGDEARVSRLIASVPTPDRAYLESLNWAREAAPEALADPVQEAHRLLGRHQYSTVVDIFLQRHMKEFADPAVEAALELDDPQYAGQVLDAVRDLIQDGFQLSRRLARDLAELEALASGTCGNWIEWIQRVSRDARWGEAAAVARQNADSWPPLPLSETVVQHASDLLVSSAEGINSDQVRASLDLLCEVASRSAKEPGHAAFLDSVLLILSAQENIGEPIRNAFNDLMWSFLESGPTRAGYEGLISAATLLWERIASPLSVDWVLELLDALVSNAAPSRDSAVQFAMQVPTRCAPFVTRISRRQASSMRTLLEEFGLPAWPDIPALDSDEDNIWAALNAADVGLYSLVENAGTKLRAQLDRLCRMRSFTHRTDTVASAGLKSLAQNADYLIVDSWHAAHAATACIDEVRPRSRQILPRRGGTPALVAAIEDALIAQTSDGD